MNDPIRRQLAVLRIIVAAMTLGVVVFAVIIAIVARKQPRASNPNLETILLVVLVALAVVGVPAYFLLRGVILRGLRTKFASGEASDAKGLLAGFNTLTIIRSAMLEGVGLFSSLSYFLTQNQLALGVTMIAVVLLLAGFPTADRFRRFAIDIMGLEGASRLTA